MTGSARPPAEPVAFFSDLGVEAFITTREAGSFALPEHGEFGAAAEPWTALQRQLETEGVTRLASARQVHGTTVVRHAGGWAGWRRVDGADGHLLKERGSAAAVTIADCIPVLIAHPSGIVGALHAGWRGVAGRILGEALDALEAMQLDPTATKVYLGPGICGRCYEVGPDVYEQLTDWPTKRARHVDLRALLAEQAKERGITQIAASPYCTKCDQDRFFSHRGGDAGRQIAVIIARP